MQQRRRWTERSGEDHARCSPDKQDLTAQREILLDLDVTRSGEYTIADLADLFSTSRATVYRVLEPPSERRVPFDIGGAVTCCRSRRWKTASCASLNPEHIVRVGEVITLKILDIDRANRRITLSHKHALAAGSGNTYSLDDQ
ncbi:helix-turn-helix domain-containing protein [Nocardia sp. NPDC047648]|uniref:helix-turn-helix domain-containing protein n=1 Tax=Nocardia sp. NPDC047648 TaxID=3155625 RepID=UPI0033DEE63F